MSITTGNIKYVNASLDIDVYYPFRHKICKGIKSHADAHEHDPEQVVIERVKKAGACKAYVKDNEEGHHVHDPCLHPLCADEHIDLFFHIHLLGDHRDGP